MAGLIVEGAAPRADCFRVGDGLGLRSWLPRSCDDGENDRFNPLMSGGGAYDAACVCADMEEPVDGREREGEGGGSSISVPALSSRIFFFFTLDQKYRSFLCACGPRAPIRVRTGALSMVENASTRSEAVSGDKTIAPSMARLSQRYGADRNSRGGKLSADERQAIVNRCHSERMRVSGHRAAIHTH